jgi:hypothetical protein
VSYRPYLESGALRQMHGLPEQGFDMLVTLLARICDDPYDPVFSAPTGVPRRRVADVGDFGAMSRGELEARVLEGDRAQATAPRDTSSQLRLTSQAEADAWRQSADAEAEHDQVQAENAKSLAAALAAETSRLETANARYEDWSARTASTREIAGKAKAELQRRGQEPSAGEAPEPQSMSTWWREFQAHADAADRAIEPEHQAAIHDG